MPHDELVIGRASMTQFAYLFERFPSFGQTFCYREVAELDRRDITPPIFSIRNPKDEPSQDWTCALSNACIICLRKRNCWMMCAALRKKERSRQKLSPRLMNGDEGPISFGFIRQ